MEDAQFRGARRSRAECRVDVKRREEGGQSFIAYTSDVAVGGLCIAACDELRVGETVDVSLTTPSRWEPIALSAEVCWQREALGDRQAETGFRFVDVTEDATAALEQLVAALAYED